ncbi:MAG: PAS domain S-box protein, partial [Methanobacterium sp.]
MEDQDRQFREIFEKSPIGILFYDKKGKLTNANRSALEIAGIPSLDVCIGLNLFDNPNIESRKEELLNNKLIRFQAPLNFDKIKEEGIYNPKKPDMSIIDYTVSLTDSGYLMQIQNITEQRPENEQKHEPLKLIKKSTEELEVSNEDTLRNEFLHAIQIPWLNLILRYGGAILGVIVAFWLYGVITAWFGPGLPTYILFYPVVIVVALLAGFGPGLLATAMAVMVAGIWILSPYGEFTAGSSINQVGVVLFGTIGVMISSVAELYHRNRKKAAAYDKEMALRETKREKEFLVDVLEHASQPFAIGYLDGRVGLFNQAFEQLTGYSTEELHTIDWSANLTPEEWRELEKQKLDELQHT